MKFVKRVILDDALAEQLTQDGFVLSFRYSLGNGLDMYAVFVRE